MPPAIFMVAVFLYPIAYAMYLSVHSWSFTTIADPPFVALENFVRLLTDPAFGAASWRTFLFVTVCLLLQFGFGLALALAVARLPRGQGVLTAVLVLPMMVTPVVVGLMWKFLFDYNFGFIGWLMTSVGLDKIAFLGDPRFALSAVILVDTWQWTPFMFLILLAGLKAMPREPFEAAMVDGANAWQAFRALTLPFLKPVIITALILRGAGLVKEFDKFFVLTGGGPGSASTTIPVLMYRSAFVDFRFSESSAIGVVMALVVAVACWFAVRAMHQDGARDKRKAEVRG